MISCYLLKQRCQKTWKNLEFDNLGKKKQLQKPGVSNKITKKPGFLAVFTCKVLKFQKYTLLRYSISILKKII